MARVLITGCASGFGRAAAQELARRGHEVVATSRRVADLDGVDVAQRLALDVTDAASVAAALGAAGPLDALVNNAGTGLSGPVERVPLEAVRRVFETNFFGAVRLIQAVLPAMRERGRGRLINVSSIAGRIGPPLGGFYAASKFALEGLSEALHIEMRPFGVRVVVVQPGFFATGFRSRSGSHGEDTPPYDALRRLWDGADQRLLGGERPGPEAVGCAVADALEHPDPPLRWPVGRDAELVLAARARMDDAAFEAAMRGMLGLDW